MLKDYFALALGNLRHRGLRSWLTMLGIFIGIAAVVSLISLGTALQEALLGQFSTLDPDKLIIQNAGTSFGPPGSTAIKKLNERDIRVIERVTQVKEVISRYIRVVLVEYGKESTYGFIGSIPEKKEHRQIVYDSLNIKIDKGKIINEETGKIMIGSDFQDSFDKKLNVGDNVLIQDKNFEVSGILKPSGSFQLNGIILMPEEDLKEILNIDDEIDLLVVQVEDESRLEETSTAIERALRRDRNQKEGEEDFSVQTPIQSFEAITTILNIVNIIVAGIAAVSLLVGGIGILNTMYSSVVERTKEIGIMKAIGAKNKDIITLFIIESGLMGIVGGVIGALIGAGLSFSVSSLANNYFGEMLFAPQFSPYLIFGAIILSGILGIFAGILPAFQASKLKPVEALRK